MGRLWTNKDCVNKTTRTAYNRYTHTHILLCVITKTIRSQISTARRQHHLTTHTLRQLDADQRLAVLSASLINCARWKKVQPTRVQLTVINNRKSLGNRDLLFIHTCVCTWALRVVEIPNCRCHWQPPDYMLEISAKIFHGSLEDFQFYVGYNRLEVMKSSPTQWRQSPRRRHIVTSRAAAADGNIKPRSGQNTRLISTKLSQFSWFVITHKNRLNRAVEFHMSRVFWFDRNAERPKLH